jgi:hypothetical protein
MGYGLDNRGSIPARGKMSFLHSVQTGYGAQPTSYAMGTGSSFRGYKAARGPEQEADHSPPSRAEVKNGGTIPPLPPYVIMGKRLIT